MSIVKKLIVEELGYCCVYSFFDGAKKYSAAAIAQSLGISHSTACYWRDKLLAGKLKPCPNCPPHGRHVELQKSAAGRFYVVRSHSR